jgi:uridylate kinase
MAKRPFQRVLLKLSGELLGGLDGQGLDPTAATAVCERVREAVGLGVEVGLVVGGGNLFRGLGASRSGMDRCAADAIGMLATVMNALALRAALEQHGIAAEVQSAIPMAGVVEAFDHRRARSLLAAGRVLLFAAGTGHPFFTTDTTAALRACQIGADVLVKGTKVDGIYDADPMKDPAAKRYAQISYDDALERRLGVMDAAAFSLCLENRLPILVFKFGVPGELARLMEGDFRSATLVSAGPQG